MTIRINEPISMAEVTEYVDKDSEISKFIKKFTKKLESLDLMKMKSEHISKIIDLLPENQEDLNKIFLGTGLDEEESKRILDEIKKYKKKKWKKKIRDFHVSHKC